MNLTLHGCIPIVVTPFLENGNVDFDGLQREVDWLIGEGATGVATLAIASEGYKLTEPERDLVTELVIEAADHRVAVVISADGAGTEVALDRATRAESLGADAVMVLPPYFVKPDQASLYDYYRQIGEALSVPVIIQDAPQLTGVAMGPALWSKLANEIESIRYVKAEGTPQGTILSETVRQSGGKLGVFCGWGGIGMIDALERGIAGSMPAPNFTRLFAEVQRRYETGDVLGAVEQFNRELPFIVWTMQSVDFSVKSAKEELMRRGVIETSIVRQPAATLDEISLRQLEGWIDARLS